jgi:hypothetical protein
MQPQAISAGVLVSDVLRAAGWTDAQLATVAPEVAEMEVLGVGGARDLSDSCPALVAGHRPPASGR